MHHTIRRKAIVRIGMELRRRGWTLFGFTEDNSNPMTDYYSPAHWDGVATHPELGDTIVCVDVDEYTVKNYSGNGHG